MSDNPDGASDDESARCPHFSYARANPSLAQQSASTSAKDASVTLVVARNDRCVIAYDDGCVLVASARDARRVIWRTRTRRAATALATDGASAHVLVADARGEIAVHELPIDDGMDANERAGGARGLGDGCEVMRTTHARGVTCAALERDYGARGRGRGGVAYGDDRGGVYVRVSTLLGHKTLTLSAVGGSDRGAARAMEWSSRGVLAWACDEGVKLYDVGRDEKVALVERPRGSPAAGMYAPHLTWNETSDMGKTLLVGWADCVKVVRIQKQDAPDSSVAAKLLRDKPTRGATREITRADSFANGGSSEGDNASASEASSARVYVARVTSMFQTEYYVAGIQPFGDLLAILGWSTDGDRKYGAHAELHLVTHANVTQNIDVIATRDDPTTLGCNAYGLACAQPMLDNGSFDRCKHVGDHRWWKIGLEPRFYVYSPKDLIVAKATGARESIDWLSKQEDYVKLLDVCELASRYGHIDGSVRDIGHSVLQRTFDERDYAQTAALCSKLLRKDAAAWETWIEKFMLARKLAELQPYIPTDDPTLSVHTYEVVLNAFLAEAEHHPRFLASVKAWPARLYSPQFLIPVVKSKLASLNTNAGSPSVASSVSSVVLKEALAELYLNDGQRERALNLYLDIGRPSVLSFIARHDLLSFVARNKLSLLAQLDIDAAMSLFVQKRESLPPRVVIPELLGQGGFGARELTHAYMSALFDEDPTCFEEFHDKLYELHLEFNPKALMNFLKKSASYDVARACALLTGNEALIFERVFLLSKLGSHEEAVRVLVTDAKDLSGAIKLASELDNPVELWNVIIKVSTDSKDFMATLLAHAKNLAGDPNAIALIHALREGVSIDNLKSRLVDLMDENIALTRSLRTSYASESKRARESYERKTKVETRALRRHQIHVSRKR